MDFKCLTVAGKSYGMGHDMNQRTKIENVDFVDQTLFIDL